LAAGKSINWQNATTVVSVAILVGTELVGLTWAAGWALGGLFQFPPVVSAGVEIAGAVVGLVLVYYFVRAALRVEPIRT
jgi:membrane associated rhomboid family serine protease